MHTNIEMFYSDLITYIKLYRNWLNNATEIAKWDCYRDNELRENNPKHL